ncbi:hypothetical protein [Methylorubrum extorquens]|uniref:Uncharacterized protein n=2 Tax=Methylorubrum extorquens TaxID=408 RepID=C5B6A8_METEA|nr:hypothetical protein [Methylorubrum extorquens]ACS43990.1 Hypothetical protein MexAM1_META2p1238 [Methylorubrum extorquens AM1]EHP95068.1 hypothetical protein MetexDRAFT_0060 [Methylorubrum extorquens DSM 13060]MCP1546151.1 hypothetical protein [Methylorubrum extorquens]MCP1590818.1 hypothetical protein [Methylorubrum extorquens]
MGQPSRWAAAYLGLLVLQTAAASSLFWMILPILRRMISRLGEPLDLEAWRLATVTGSVIVLQSCYWIRHQRAPVYAAFRNVVIGHLLMFASRASFFFGGAFFSLIYFRHVPELSVLPPLGQGFAKALAIFVILFSLFCYSLELERLGK